MSLTLPAFAGGWKDIIHPSPSSQNANVEIGELTGGMVIQDFTDTSSFPSVPTILTYIYLIGAAITLIYSLAGTFQLIAIIGKGEKMKRGRYTLVITDRNDIAPFSWLNYYVMNRNDYETACGTISIHERRHLKLLHWADLIIVQIVGIFQWFNPAAWLMGEEFKTVHEYQADEAVIQSGINLRQYQTLLIKKAVGTRFQVLANSLNHSKLKKRVTMMYKSKPSKLRRFGALLLIPAMGIGCSVIEIPAVAAVLDTTSTVSLLKDNGNKVNDFSADNENDNVEIINKATEISDISVENNSNVESNTGTSSEDAVSDQSESKSSAIESAAIESHSEPSNASDTDKALSKGSNQNSKVKKEEVYPVVEESPEFPGGMSELMKWLANNIRYPEKAHKEDIQGRVIVKFVVEKDGKIGETTIVKGVDPELDKEAVRVVRQMPAWIPGKVKGESVATYFNIPITFKLQDETPKEAETPTSK